MSVELRDIVADVLDVSPKEIGDTFGPDTTDRWDSMNHLRMITAIEDEYRIQFSMEEIQSIENFGRLWRLVAEKRG